MMENAATDKATPVFRGRFLGQVTGLFLWPLLTVVLVAGALYYDRVRNLTELTIQKETLLVRAVTLLIQAGRHAAAADLKLLLEDQDFINATSHFEIPSRSGVSGLLDDLLDRNPAYEQVVLLDLEGHELARRGRGEADAESQAKLAATERNRAYLVDALARPPGTLLASPAELILCRGSSPDRIDPLIRLGVSFDAVDGRHGMVAAIDYRLSDFAELIREIGTGERGLLMIARDLSALARVIDDEAGDYSLAARRTAIRQVIGGMGDDHFFQDGNLYSFAHFSVPSRIFAVNDNTVGTSDDIAGQYGSVEQWTVISELPAGFFVKHKKTYLLFLSFLALALLVPSFVVCVFWAKARIRAWREAELRAVEQVEHLVRLEQKVRERTRELDDRNLQLSGEIAERLNAEIRLRQSNELLTGMVESIDGIIYVADFESYEILYANEYLKKLFGFNPIGKKCWQFIHASKDGPCSFCVNHRLLDEEGEPTGPYQWEYQNPFNKRWYTAKDLAIRWSSGKYVKLEIAIDITEQKQLQQFLQEARRQAEIARNMRSRFVALVAHDLKSPFYSITQMLKRILEREAFSSEIHRQFLENIVTNGHRMLQMIDDLLSMDRFESAEVKLDRTFFDGAAMADEVMRNFAHLASDKALRLVNRLPADCTIYADKYLYFVVLNNLLSNAIKFSETGGVIEVFLPDRKRPMTVAVRDEGKGMSRDYVDNLFRAEVKTSSKGTKGEPGSGLGLLFCQDILKAHGGELAVTSELGVGTVFSIVLPECCFWETSEGSVDLPAIGSSRSGAAD